MSEAPARYYADTVGQRIVTIRGQKVVLDTDLACLYGVEVKRLNEQVKRNRTRFPEDFVFQLTAEEFAGLRTHNATRSAPLRSQDATLEQGGGRRCTRRVWRSMGLLLPRAMARALIC
jgi:hypothetical protein